MHQAAGLVMVALLADLARTGRDVGANGGTLRWVVVGALLVLTAFVLFLGDTQQRAALPPVEEFATRVWGLGSCLFVVGALAMLVVEIVHLAGMDDLPDESSEDRFARLDGVDRVANGLMASGLTLLFALLVAVLARDRLRWRDAQQGLPPTSGPTPRAGRPSWSPRSPCSSPSDSRPPRRRPWPLPWS